MIVCNSCGFEDAVAVAGVPSEERFLRTMVAWDAEVLKEFSCSFECYLERCLKAEFYGRKDPAEATAKKALQYVAFSEARKPLLAAELLRMPGVQDFLRRTGTVVSYSRQPRAAADDESAAMVLTGGDWADL